MSPNSTPLRLPRRLSVADQKAAIKAAMQEMMKRNAEAPNSGQRPPGLASTEDSHVNCSTCLHWKAGTCSLYDYRTQPDMVCESWSPLPE
jgi:hypothetical protein